MWQQSEAVDVDRGQLVWRRLKDVVVIVHLHELTPGGERPESGGGASGSPKWVRIFRIGLGSVMKAIGRMSPPKQGTQGETPPPPGP
jgi:hypothetical protein